jgi:hypothetical protein
MSEAYDLAVDEIAGSLAQGEKVLDCGAHSGGKYEILYEKTGIKKEEYFGIEWDSDAVNQAKNKGLNIIQGDLNKGLLRVEFPLGDFLDDPEVVFFEAAGFSFDQEVVETALVIFTLDAVDGPEAEIGTIRLTRVVVP